MQLVSPPMIYLALNAIIDDPSKTMQDAAQVIKSDAGLTMRLLKIVNSAFYGFPQQIDSVSRAISMIGTRELQNLALATVVIDRFSDLPGASFSVQEFWARNLRCALIAKELDFQQGKKYRDVAFVCGLLHHIGLLVMYRRIPVLMKEVELLLRSQVSEWGGDIRLERQVIGFDHFQVGAALCRLWKLPEIIAESITLHDASLVDTDTFADIAGMVRTADALASIDSLEQCEFNTECRLSLDQLGPILDKVNDEFELIFQLFCSF